MRTKEATPPAERDLGQIASKLRCRAVLCKTEETRRRRELVGESQAAWTRSGGTGGSGSREDGAVVAGWYLEGE